MFSVKFNKNTGRFNNGVVCNRKERVKVVVNNVLVKEEVVKPKTAISSELAELEKSVNGYNDTIDLETQLQILESQIKYVETNEIVEQEKESQEGNKFSGSIKGMVLLNIGALLFGSNQVAIKTTEELLAPTALSAIRFIINGFNNKSIFHIFQKKIILYRSKIALQLNGFTYFHTKFPYWLYPFFAGGGPLTFIHPVHLMIVDQDVLTLWTDDPPLLVAQRYDSQGSIYCSFPSFQVLHWTDSNPKIRAVSISSIGCWLFGGYQAQAYGLAATTAARGAFTGTFTVLAVPILVGLSGRRIPFSTWIAAVIAIFGVGLLTTSGGDFNSGDAWCIASAILFGVHKFRTETITARFKEETQDLIAVQLLVLATLSSLFALPLVADTITSGQGLQDIFQNALNLPWTALAYMGLATTAFTLWIEMESLKEVSAPLAALIYTSEPLWGAAFAWILLDERWGATGWLGAFLIISSSLFCQLSGEQAEKVSDKEINLVTDQNN